jgi:hypothetical protein
MGYGMNRPGETHRFSGTFLSCNVAKMSPTEIQCVSTANGPSKDLKSFTISRDALDAQSLKIDGETFSGEAVTATFYRNCRFQWLEGRDN